MTSTVIQANAAAAAAGGAEMLPPLYTFAEREKVQQYIASNLPTRELLADAPAHIAALFGPDTSVRLEIRCDPEYPQPPELWALILADMSTPEKTLEAEQNLRRLHDAWLIHLPRALSGSVHFDVEYL